MSGHWHCQLSPGTPGETRGGGLITSIPCIIIVITREVGQVVRQLCFRKSNQDYLVLVFVWSLLLAWNALKYWKWNNEQNFKNAKLPNTLNGKQKILNSAYIFITFDICAFILCINMKMFNVCVLILFASSKSTPIRLSLLLSCHLDLYACGVIMM